MNFSPALYLESKIMEIATDENSRQEVGRIMNQIVSLCGRNLKGLKYGNIIKQTSGYKDEIYFYPEKGSKGIFEKISVVAIKNDEGTINLSMNVEMGMKHTFIKMKDSEVAVIVGHSQECTDGSATNKGIYYIKPYNDEGELKCNVTYYDGEVLDAIDSSYRADMSNFIRVREFISTNDENLKRVGFRPDFITTCDKEDGFISEHLISTYNKGSKEAFDKWVEKVMAKENEMIFTGLKK